MLIVVIGGLILTNGFTPSNSSSLVIGTLEHRLIGTLTPRIPEESKPVAVHNFFDIGG
jgi:hypothetical protein